ncbi:MAG: Peptide deformylase [Chlamydiae bacterium]|nr:Peptide deformylase [Chlamydiota bacterium]
MLNLFKKKSILLGVCLMCIGNSSYSIALQFIPSSDPRLNQKAKKVSLEELKSIEIKTLIHEMLVLSGFEADPQLTKKKARLVGIAAPQVGVMKQIIIIDSQSKRRAAAEFEVLINPEILWESSTKKSIPQGCYSVPNQFNGLVERSNEVVVQALNLKGEVFQKRYEGYPAHVVQHEIDHLHGIRFPERLSDEKLLHILPNGDADLKNYRKNWKNWPHHASPELWSQLKKGNYFFK